MEISGARILVTGGSGVLGSGLATALHEAGARVVLAGRDSERLQETAGVCGDAPTLDFEALDVERCRELPGKAASALGGLDSVLAAHGLAGFGPATAPDDADFEQLMAVNALAPMALLGAAARHIGAGGTLAAITAILVDRPMAGMGAYAASKAALAAWLTSLRGELRRERIAVLDIRAPHIDTGLMGRALMGEPPSALPSSFDRRVFENAVVRSLEQGTKVLRFDPRSGEPVAD